MHIPMHPSSPSPSAAAASVSLIRLLRCAALLVACSIVLVAAEAGHGEEGPAQRLGVVSMGDLQLQISLHGAIAPGADAVIGIAAASSTAPAELRSWIGVRNGRGSVKSLMEADEHGHFHGHLEVPDQLPEDSALWVEVVTDSGRQRASVALPETAAAQAVEDAHAGHDHAAPEDHSGHEH